MPDDTRDLHLDVYDTKHGWWNPDHGELEIPDGWVFLPQRDAFLTRTVKAAGQWWQAWLPRSRSRRHRRKVGIWAPAESLALALEKAVATEAVRARRQERRPAERERQQARDAEELTAAIVAFLAFEPGHSDLAGQIAREAAARATVVGSGRVGRTRTLTLEERAALAGRAYIRHRFTKYEADLDSLWGTDLEEDVDTYLDVKSDAHLAVDEFLARHRG